MFHFVSKGGYYLKAASDQAYTVHVIWLVFLHSMRNIVRNAVIKLHSQIINYTFETPYILYLCFFQVVHNECH